jgi:hypothetical protein
MTLHFPAAALLALLTAGAAQAEELFPTTDALGPTWGVGLGVLYENEGYVGGKAEAELIPALFY